MMEKFNDSNYCIVLAGGKGKRLWPASRENRPKQFLDFFSTGRSLLQATFDRMVSVIPAKNIIITTNIEYTGLVKEQLPEIYETNILSEPVSRNTAPSVAWALHRILHQNERARVVIVPSDQMITDENAFRHDVTCGLDWVTANGNILAMGVKPSRPEPGYGYIQKDGVKLTDCIYSVKSFTEKPEREFAKMFMNSGEFLWNTGMFIARGEHLWNCLCDIFPPVLRALDNGDKGYSIAREESCIEERYSVYPNLSIDYAILEKTKGVSLMQCSFGWADLGTWHSMYETMSRGEGDNVVLSNKVLLDKCHGNIIKMPDDHIAILNGLNGYIVAEKGNVLLVCKKEDSSALIRKYVNEVQIKEGEKFM